MGLNHLNGRVEDATTGRFLSPDPYVPDPGNTQSFNRYGYVLNNPVTLVDISGFSNSAPVHCYDDCANFVQPGITVSASSGQSNDAAGAFAANSFAGNSGNPNVGSTSGGSSGSGNNELPTITVTATRPAKNQPVPPPWPCPTGGDGFEAAQAGQSFADGSVGVVLGINKDFAALSGALRGAGGLFAIGSIYHGYKTGNYVEMGFGSLDVIATVASAFPPADFVTGPYFAGRLGMGIVDTLAYAATPQSTCGGR